MVQRALLHQEMDQLQRENENRRAEAESYRQQLQAVLNTKRFRFFAPLRKAYGRLHRGTGLEILDEEDQLSETTSTDPMAGDGLPLRLAFYLPQFHSTPENGRLAWTGIH